MSEHRFLGSLYYFDLVAVLLTALIVVGRLFVPDSPSSPTPLHDVAGFWAPVVAVALVVLHRRRARRQVPPWVAAVFAALAVVALAAIFWRWHIVAFVAAIGVAALLLPGGLVLRTRRLTEPLSRPDLFALIALTAGLCLGVALVEVGLRLAPGLVGPELQRMLGADARNYGIAHPYIGHLHRPDNTFVLSGRDFHAVNHVDGLGFRNAWPWPERAEIVAVGDSLTFGYGVADDQAWPSLLKQSAAPNRVVNLGLIGAGPQQYLRVLETFGPKLRPKVVLVGVFPQNDFWDAEVFDRWLDSGVGGNYMVWRDFGRPEPVKFSVRDPVGSLQRLLRATVYSSLKRTYTYTLLRALRGGTEGPAAAPPRLYEFPDGGRLQLRESDYLFMSAAARPSRREFRLLLRALRQIDDLATREGAHALMVLQPGKEQVYLPLLGETQDDSTDALRAALDRLGIEYLDLAPAFRARAAAGDRLFFAIDGHPNQAGYALTAELLQAHLTEHAPRYGLIQVDSAASHERPTDHARAASRHAASD
jgi:lysophospholipase L1-like esterase